jgi:hypothetical protein
MIGHSEKMHRRILPQASLIDHIDGNGLNNTRTNLRPSNKSQNAHNRRNKDAGITWHSQTKKFRVRVKIDYKEHHIGLFETLELARLARDEARRWLGIPYQERR